MNHDLATARYGYLGPAGTFTQQALKSFHEGASEAFVSVLQALDAVRDGSVDGALVPIENSIEGGVSATLDYLARPNDPLQIVREVIMPVEFDLCVRPGISLADVHTVASHPHALAQVRGWLTAQLPDADVVELGSTAAAAQAVAAGEQIGGKVVDAAVCAAVAGELNGLESIVTGIADNRAAQTRFVLVTKPGAIPERSGHDKTTLVAYLRRDHPGALLDILQQFATRGVNLCRIESRPTKTSLGQYCFSIDAEGHVEDARLADTLVGLRRTCQDVVFLGSYARADGQEPTVRVGSTDDDYAAAKSWLDSLTR